MAIVRQDPETSVDELIGNTCMQLLGVPGHEAGDVSVLYLLADRQWHRFFTDAGLLFLDESTGPDPEDDLEPGQEYLDLASMLECAHQPIVEFSMHERTLRFRCAQGRTLILHNSDDGTLMQVA